MAQLIDGKRISAEIRQEIKAFEKVEGEIEIPVESESK